MKFVLAPDSFKESMSAKEVAIYMENGIKKALPNATCIKVPMSDGGEGTMHSLVDATNGKIFKTKVIGPLGIPVIAEFGLLGDKKTAVIEMASASGLYHVKNIYRNPLITTTYGTGELIKHVLDKGIKHILIGIGGSATNDGGVGMMQALGVDFLTKEMKNIGFGGGELDKIYTIDITNMDKRLSDVTIDVACDVTNPLIGKNGASYIFGPQKGATPQMVKILDNNLKHYANIIKHIFNIDVANIPGAGAAGGMGASLIAFLNANLKKGIDTVINYTKLEDKIINADFIFTGEGCIDKQTSFGKTPYGVANIARKHNIPVIAIAGKIGNGTESLYNVGINSIFSILTECTSLDEALLQGKENVENICENIARLLSIRRQP